MPADGCRHRHDQHSMLWLDYHSGCNTLLAGGSCIVSNVLPNICLSQAASTIINNINKATRLFEATRSLLYPTPTTNSPSHDGLRNSTACGVTTTQPIKAATMASHVHSNPNCGCSCCCCGSSGCSLPVMLQLQLLQRPTCQASRAALLPVLQPPAEGNHLQPRPIHADMYAVTWPTQQHDANVRQSKLFVTGTSILAFTQQHMQEERPRVHLQRSRIGAAQHCRASSHQSVTNPAS